MKIFCAVVRKAEEIFEVNIDAGASVTALKKAIKQVNEDVKISSHKLQLFLTKKNDAWLKDDDTLDEMLRSGDVTSYQEMWNASWKLNKKELLGPGVLPTKEVVHVLVVIPPQVPPQRLALVPAVRIPAFTALDNCDQYLLECSLDEWKVGEVRDLPLISHFMEPLGGCTKKKKILWREEEKQVASILLGGWFKEPSGASSNTLANTKSVLVGSPGVGKSTLLILMAFYLVLKHKKNVLVYRWLDMGDCLFYLGYQAGTVVYFTVERCSPELVVAIYEELNKRQGFSNVWLLLDKLDYQRIPPGLNTFKLLATSEKAEVALSDLDEPYLCLLPAWKKQDLFKLGRKLYNFEEKNMEDRVYFSGGSVRVFTRNPFKDVRLAISNACVRLKDLSGLFPEVRVLHGDTTHFDRLRHIFLKDSQNPSHYLLCSSWENIIDSEYALLLLSQTLRLDELHRFFRWALKAGHGALAGTIFGICLHRLAIDKNLILHMSECNPCKQEMKRKKTRNVGRIRLEMKEGDAFCSDTATKDGYDEDELKEWRDDDTLSYWYPYCDDFPNIDGIVKLKPSFPDKKNRVAFLHLTVGQQHAVDEKQLELLEKRFAVDDFEPPIYVVLCPDFESSDNIVVKRGSPGAKERESCQVFVGCYDEPALECNDDDWRYTVTRKEEKPVDSYNLPPTSEYGNSDVVKLLLTNGAAADMANNDGETALILATQFGETDVMELLLAEGVSINKQRTKDGANALRIACIEGRLNAVKCLLKYGASADFIDGGNYTPLRAAAWKGRTAMVGFLLDQGASVDLTGNEGLTPLMSACEEGHVDVVAPLLKRGAIVDKQAQSGQSTLHIACLNGHLEVTRLILEHGAAIDLVDTEGNSPLHWAASNRHAAVLRLLTERGASSTLRNNSGLTPLQIAEEKSHKEVVTVLKKRWLRGKFANLFRQEKKR